jgi:3-hydroxybutyryl-CoA dehydratase
MNSFQFEEMAIGISEEFVAPITNGMMDSFLSISGDINPLHVDVEYAREKDFSDRVVYGMLTSALYSKLAGVYLPGKYCLLQGVDLTFHHPVYVGDILTVRGEVCYLNEAYRMVEIKAYIKNQDGKKISKAKIKAGFL